MLSQLFTGSISDKELFQRSGLKRLLQQIIEKGELLVGDSVMCDRGFTIEKDLEEIGLVLNQPPFLEARDGFTKDEIITTRTIATHRIHVERAIRKVKTFHFFDNSCHYASYD